MAHNPDGVRALVASLRAEPPPRPIVAVVAVLKDKAWREMLELLRPEVDQLILTRAPSAPAERAWDVEGMEPDFGRALARAQIEGATVLVTGSFHTVGDAMVALHIDP